jgi:hypothetical protein
MDLESRVRELLGKKVEMPRSCRFDHVYHDEFEASGIKKAVEVLKDLQNRNDIDLSTCAYFSIGGSTGSELFHVVNNSLVTHGILLEFSSDATEVAHAKRNTLFAGGKDMVIITGRIVTFLS